MMESFVEFFQTAKFTVLMSGVALLVFLRFTFDLIVDLRQNHRDSAKVLGLIILLGTVLRAVWIQTSQPEPLSDFAVYWHYAINFFNGDYTYVELSRHPGIPSLFFWAFQIFKPGIHAAWALNIAFSMISIALMFQITRILSDTKTAYVAAALYAVFPNAIAYNALFASEIMATTYALMVVWVFLSYKERLDKKELAAFNWAGLGILLYATVMIRSSNLLYIGIFFVCILLFRRKYLSRALKQYAVFAVTAGLLLSGWMFHQYLNTGQAKMFWGAELWLSCAVQYDKGGRYTHTKDMAFWPEIKHYWEEGTLQSRIKAYDVIWDKSLDIVKEDPVRYLEFGFVRMRNIFKTSQSGISWSAHKSEFWKQQENLRLKKTLSVASNVMWQILLGLAVFGVGLLVAFRNRMDTVAKEGWVLIGLFSLAWLTFHYLLAVASERYAFQMLPYILMLAAYALVQVLRFVKGKFKKA